MGFFMEQRGRRAIAHSVLSWVPPPYMDDEIGGSLHRDSHGRGKGEWGKEE